MMTVARTRASKLIATNKRRMMNGWMMSKLVYLGVLAKLGQ